MWWKTKGIAKIPVSGRLSKSVGTGRKYRKGNKKS